MALLTFITVLFLATLPANAAVPKQLDWRKSGVIAPPVNQGSLGDSGVFAVVEAIQSYYAINTGGRLVRLSVNELSDCCGEFENLYDCILRTNGVCTEADYPSKTGTCHSSSCIPAVSIKGYKNVTSGDENKLQEAVLINPVVALINAGLASFQTYRSGVYDDAQCTAQQLDHAVLIVGYGTLAGQDYWICENSWGVNWGMKGYILIARNKGNMCGIASAASYPI